MAIFVFNFNLDYLIYAYFIAGISGSLFAYFAQKLFGPSQLFSHGKAAANASIACTQRHWVTELTVSKHLFWHFYASGFFLSIFYYKIMPNNSNVSAALLAVQCFRRLIECFFVMPGGRDSQMHLIHYLIGLSYYPALLLSFSLQKPSKRNAIWIVLFIIASGFQSYCHWILGQERSSNSKKKADHRPLNNTIFKFIHTPHYFAEFLIYTSIAGLNGFHPLSLLNLIWIITILGVSAKNSADWLTERWKYKSFKEFCEYLMIPFLF